LRSVCQKSLSSFLVFIVCEIVGRGFVAHHEALAGFLGTSFEGGGKSGGERGRLLEYSVRRRQTLSNNDNLS
jgi:hypothetical protein